MNRLSVERAVFGLRLAKSVPDARKATGAANVCEQLIIGNDAFQTIERQQKPAQPVKASRRGDVKQLARAWTGDFGWWVDEPRRTG